MTEIMPSLQNLIKLSYDSPGFGGFFFSKKLLTTAHNCVIVLIA